jgi:hypothetical protein
VNWVKDFFISYSKADKDWAEWIAWTLEEAGYSVVIQAWDFRPGGNFVLEMHKAAAETEKTVPVLSEDYLKAEFTHPEWAAATGQAFSRGGDVEATTVMVALPASAAAPCRRCSGRDLAGSLHEKRDTPRGRNGAGSAGYGEAVGSGRSTGCAGAGWAAATTTTAARQETAHESEEDGQHTKRKPQPALPGRDADEQ